MSGYRHKIMDAIYISKKMIHRFLFILFIIGNCLSIQGQSLNDYLKKNKIPYYHYKDSSSRNKMERSKTGYFFTNSKGQTTLTLPKGAVDMSAPTGDSVVYVKITSPKFKGKTMGQLLVSQFHNNEKVNETPIGMGEINGSIGIRVDAVVDNKKNCSLFLYFLSGQIMTCSLTKEPGHRIDILQLTDENEEAVFGKEIQSCLLFEDTNEDKNQKHLEQQFKKLSKNDFLKEVENTLDNYYIISYKLKER